MNAPLRVAFVSFTAASAGRWKITEQWRVDWPTEALQARGQVVVNWVGSSTTIAETIRQVPRKPDLIILPRLFNPRTPGTEQTDNVVAWINAIHQLGCAVAADLDDDPHYAGPALAESTVTYLRLCDGVTVATEKLAEVVRAYVRPGVPVVVVPNAILPEPYLTAQELGGRSVAPLTVGWAGTPRAFENHVETGIAGAWGEIADRYPNVNFVLIGVDSGDTLPVVLEGIGGVPRERMLTAPGQEFDLYPYALLNVDIACCPLISTPFNVCKSPQKAWEHILTGAAVVCSPTVYADDTRLVECGGLLASNADEWVDHLSRLIDNAEERQARVASLRRFVLQERSLEANLWRWPQAWQTIVSAAARGTGSHQLARADTHVRAQRKAERQNRQRARLRR